MKKKRFLIPLLMAIVMMAMSPQRLWAETQFISEIAISTNTNSNSAGGAAARSALESNGYTIVTGDINTGTGGSWAYLGVKYTTNPKEAMTGIMICKGEGERQDKMEEGSGGYVTIVDDTYSDRKWYRAKRFGHCNIDDKGVGLTVYYTRYGNNADYGNNSGKPLVTSLAQVNNDTGVTGVTYVPLWEGTSNDDTNYQGKITNNYADCNKGAGGAYIYLYYNTHSHTLKDVDCDDYAYHDYRCTACEYIHQHNVHNTPQQDVSATYLKSAATCTEAAVYYHKCKYCGGKMSSTYTYGSALGHTYTNGVCTKTPNQTHYEPCSGSGTSADPYLISNNGNLMWFSDVTNGYNGLTRNLEAQGKLTTDLDMSGLTFTSIALYSDKYSTGTYFKGVFDGQGHVISNLNVTAPDTYEAGFVSRLQGTVKNLILYKETVKATPYVSARIGGIAGLTHTNAVISCCGVIGATLKNENDKTNSVQLGGIVGGYSTGAIAFTFTDHNKFFGVGDLSIHTNCFENVSSDWKTSGELCWRLNGGAVTGQVWHQNLSGTSIDAYPIPTATNHSTVYMQYADKKVSFSNTSSSVTADQTVSISTAAELREMAYAIALGYSGKINVNQTADIDYTGYNTVNDMIGGDITNYDTGAIGSKVYKGTYDGQGHYIKVGFNFGEVRYVGLFRAVDGATIKNLHTTGSITTDELFCGGVVALVANNRLSLQNVTSDVTITSTHTTDVGNGGLVGYSKVGTNYTNCAFYGKFVGASATTPYWGGLSGRADANDLITNCYVAFTTSNIKSSQYNYTFSSKIDGNSKNYYRLNSLGTDQGTAKTADQFKSGEVCFLLNGGAVSGQAWHQTINTDSYPLLNNTRGTVYITLDKDCEFAYTHTPYADQTLSFEIGTAAKLNNVARLHANGFTGKVDVTLTADIDYTAYKTVYDMIGCYDLRPYKGTFDGQGHSLTVDITHGENYVGPFRSINGATIKNLHLKGSVTNTNYKFTGGVASHAIGDTCRLENVISDVQINCSLANDVSNGGIIAHVTVPVTIKNCAYRGKFNGSSSYAWGGFIGWLNAGQTATITNCYVALDSESSYNSKNCATFARQGGTLAGGNNYYYSLIGVDNWSNCSQFAAGELCYKLNGSRSEGTDENPLAWYQKLDTDTYPHLTKADGNTVYAGYVNCTDMELSYANSKISSGSHTMTEHPAKDPTCTIPGISSTYWSCSVCNRYFSDETGTTVIAADSWVIPATGHNMTEHPYEASVCANTGIEQYWACSNTCCNGKYYKDSDGTEEYASAPLIYPSAGNSHDIDESTGRCKICNDYWPAYGMGTERSPYLIGNVEQLYWFATRANKYDKYHAKLISDITINDGTFATDGTFTATGATTTSTPRNWNVINTFSGTFDGDGHTIKGLYVYKYNGAKYTETCTGFICNNYGTIQNLGIKTAFCEGVSQFKQIGGFCSYNYGKISNCHIDGAILTTHYKSGGGRLICGAITNWNYGTVTHCSASNVNITAEDFGAGFVYAAGICAYSDGGNIENCHVWNININFNDPNIDASYDVGGICGLSHKSNISNCYSMGVNIDITTGDDPSAYIGGIAGNLNYASITNVYTADVNVKTNITTKHLRVGGIAGCLSDANITNGYTTHATPMGSKSSTSVTKVEGSVTPQRFQSGEIAWLLNGSVDESGTWTAGPTDGTQTWYQTLDGTSYPVLTKNDNNNTVYYGYTNCMATQMTYSNSFASTNKTDLHTLDANGVCTATGCTARQIAYRVPTYNTAGVPTSGIKSWSTQTVMAYPVTSGNQSWWGTSGEDSWYYVSGNVSLWKATCNGNVHLILCDGANLTVNGGDEIGINVTGDNNSLSIYAQSEGAQTGVLSSSCKQYGYTGIGSMDGNCSNITINGGVITATGEAGPGIGSAWGNCSYIIINGGTVTAISTYSGAGIGCGDGRTVSCSNIIINGGTVTATGNDDWLFGNAGIGCKNGTCSNITINGGMVMATGGAEAAGIGCGNYGTCSNIAINGGIVKATGGAGGAAIGSSEGEVSNIKISTTMTTYAGSSENPTDVIANDGGDLAETLRTYGYAMVIPPATWSWADDGSNATVTICNESGDNLVLDTSTTPAVSITVTNTATCTSAGITTYNASVINKGITYNAPTKEVLTPMSGHNFDANGVCTKCWAGKNADVYACVQQGGTKLDQLGTAAFNLSDSWSTTLEFVNGKAVMTSGTAKVAELPMSDKGQLVLEFNTSVPEDDLNKVSKTVTAAGYATLYSPFQLAVPAEGNVEVYAPTYDETTHTLKLKSENKVNGEVIPAGTGVMLKNTGDATFTITAAAPTYTEASALTGSAVKIANPTKDGEVDGKTVYTLGKETTTQELGFFAYTGEYLNAGLAFLYVTTVDAPSNAKAIRLVFDDEDATSISELGADGLTCAEPVEVELRDGKYLENGQVVIIRNGMKFNSNGQRLK